MPEVKSEDTQPYFVDKRVDHESWQESEEYWKTRHKGDTLIEDAMKVLSARIRRPETFILNPEDMWNYLKLKIAQLPYEVFGCVFLNNRHGVIEAKELFRGTIDGATVHSREVVRDAIDCNAAAVVFYHNHPSGNPEPSQVDVNLTRSLTAAYNVIGVRVLDHIVIGGTDHVSMAERGLI